MRGRGTLEVDGHNGLLYRARARAIRGRLSR